MNPLLKNAMNVPIYENVGRNLGGKSHTVFSKDEVEVVFAYLDGHITHKQMVTVCCPNAGRSTSNGYNYVGHVLRYAYRAGLITKNLERI